MKYLIRLFIFLSFIFLYSCSGADKKEISVIDEKNIEQMMINSYKEGVEALVNGDVLFAAKKFNEAELVYPQSIWAPKSSLMAAYAYYTQAYFYDSIYESERFIKTYPNNKNISYAHYILAMSYYDSIVDEKKDLEPMTKSKEQFELILTKFPETDFAMDAKYKLDLINNFLAAKEMNIGRHYIEREKWIAAINRFKNVTDNFGTTVYVEEALHRLVEIHYNIGLNVESEKYANILGYNYLSSEWYKKSYKVFNKDYKIKSIKIKKKKNKKKSILKKLKSLINGQ